MIKITPEHYRNREWSWLSFNNRVLFEAEEQGNPLLERLKFTAIVSSNLEEFFMIRVAGLQKQQEAAVGGTSPDTLSPQEQLAGVRERVLGMRRRQYANLRDSIVPGLAAAGVTIILDDAALAAMEQGLAPVFRNEILPVLTPLSVGSTHPFPNLVTGRMYLAVVLEAEPGLDERIEQSTLSFIEIPVLSCGRFIRLEEGLFVPVELLIRRFAGEIYRGYRITSASLVKCTRDADFSLQEDSAGDLLKEIESKIGTMHHRSVVKVEHEASCPERILEVLRREYRIGAEFFFPVEGLLNLNDLHEIHAAVRRPELKDAPLVPVPAAAFDGPDIFQTIAEGDRLLFHPYHAYDPVLRLVEEAAVDPDVMAIKQTLYRTSSRSRIIQALVRAARNGKYVSVIVELKARFDEKRNINWAKVLEDAGAHVIYGLAGLKTHAKALMVVRKEPQGIRRYVHLGTGNYNETTANLYTDFSLFTCEERTGRDVSMLFNLLTGFCHPGEFERLSIAPLHLRRRFVELIGREKENALKGRKARITAVMNSLTDRWVADALYDAAAAGVRIRLIVRGMCILKPGLKGFSDNITVTSIVGRYLQHPRLYIFYNGGDEEYYLSSADWMLRNLDRRIELLFPVLDPALQELLRRILRLLLEDRANAWTLTSDGEYAPPAESGGKDSFREIHAFLAAREKSLREEKEVLFRAVKAKG